MKKQEDILTLSENIRRLFQVIYQEQKKPEKEDEDIPKIRVSEIISKMAFYYEKIRNAVDYKEENLLRKDAIERILKRQVVIEGAIKISTSEKIAKDLLAELIRGGYLPNNKIPEDKIKEVGNLIEKYLKLRSCSLSRISFSEHVKDIKVGKAKDDLREINDLTNWILALAASEIEENLGRDKIKEAVVADIYETLIKKVKLPADLPYEKDKDIQIYLSIHRSFLKFDQEMLEFILFKYFNAGWAKGSSNEEITKITQNIKSLRKAIANQINHPLAKQLDKIVRQYAVCFSILTEVIERDPTEVYDEVRNDIKAFPRLIKKACTEEYKKIRSKLWRAAGRSIIYIFLTKSIFVVLLEIPAIQWFGEEVNPVSLAINVSFPALLLFLIVLFTRIPSERNTARVIEKIEEITFVEMERGEPFILRKPAKRGKIANAFFGLIYFITFLISFGLIVWALDKINFTWVSIIIFLFFLALVSFFSLRIRRGVRAFIVVEQKENFLTFLMDFLYTPIIAAGKWLSEKFSQINVFIFVLDFIIEAPFKIFVEITEDWTKYVKERREEIE